MSLGTLKGWGRTMLTMAQVWLDPELRAVGKVIRATATAAPASVTRAECDCIFLDRLSKHPASLKLSFWEDHFEWRSLADYPQIRGHVLDFGCGSGHLDVMLARSGQHVHGIDMSPVGISIANHLRSRESDVVRKRLSFAAVDVTAARPGGEPLFDSAWSAHVFEHVPDPAPVFESLTRWLKPDASMLISVPLGNAYDDPGHVHHFRDREAIRAHFGSHVDITKIDISDAFQVIRVLCRLKR